MTFSQYHRLLLAVTSVAILAHSAEPRAAGTVPLAELSKMTHIHGIAVDPTRNSRLLLATHHGFLAVQIDDGMATRISRDQNDYMGFTLHPENATVMFASGHPSSGGNLGFIGSDDGGESWQQLSPGIRDPVDFHAIAVSKADPMTIYGAYRGLLVSRDGGKVWNRVGPLPDGFIDLAASTIDAKRLYAATSQGLRYSMDGGASWQVAHHNRAPATMIETTADGVVFAYLVGVGLVRSREPSLHWSFVNNGFGERYLMHFAVDSRAHGILYAVTNQGEILTSRNGGAYWVELGTP